MMQVKLSSSTLDIAHKVVTELLDLVAHIYKVADSGSVYMKFEQPGVGTLRIGTHHGMLKYRFRWNIRKDIEEFYEENDRGVVRYYFPWDNLDLFYQKIRIFAATIPDKAEGEYNHGTRCNAENTTSD